MRRIALVVIMLTSLLFPASIFAENIPDDVLARIKSKIAERYPGNYSMQKMLVDADVNSWKELQRNYTGVPDSVFLDIRGRVAERYPDNFSMQKMLVDADAKAWKELNR